METPLAPKKSYQHAEHGVFRDDPYYWLRERDDPEVLSYLEQENAYTEQKLQHLDKVRDSLFEEMLAKIQEDDQSVPYKKGDYWYYSRTEEGKSYSIYCRKKHSLEAPEEVILDLNVLGEQHEYLDLGAMAVSPDQDMLLYSIDTQGRELYTIYLLHLTEKRLSPVTIENTTGSIGWSASSSVFLYTRADDTLRPYQVWGHRLAQGELGGEETLLYQDDDDLFRVGFYKSRSQRFLFVYSVSSLTTEIHVLPSENPFSALRLFSPRHTGLEYWVSDAGDRFLIRNNDCDDEKGVHTLGCQNYQLHEATYEQTDRAFWTLRIPHREDVQLTSVEAFSSFWVLCERFQGLERYRILDHRQGTDTYIEMPEPVYMLGGGINIDFHTRCYRFTYSSLVSPFSTIDFLLDTQEWNRKKETPVPNYDREKYTCFRIMVPSHDGVEIPVSIVHRTDIERSQIQPLYLYAYGSYGMTMDPYFSSTRLSLLDRGAIFALAHPRGGGMLGRQWYEEGKFLKKKNTFFDFVSVAKHLIAQGYTSPQKLIISGGSAGGLLIGAVINSNPELFHAAVAAVPFVDVVTTMLDDSIPLTTGEWEEWGNPQEEEYFHYMLSYSPYDNVKEQEYPHLLVTAGLHDPRVQYWEPAKWVAKLRATKKGNQDLFLKTEMGAGHLGQTGRYGYLKDTAYDYAFVLDKWGMLEPTERD